MLSLYSSQYLGIIAILDRVFALEVTEARRIKQIYENFLGNTEELRKFINSHQYIQGFQISTSEFYQGDKKVLSNLEEYIKLLQEKKDVNMFKKVSESMDLSESSKKNVEIIEGRSSLQRITHDFSQFNEDDLQLVEDDPPEDPPEQEKPVNPNFFSKTFHQGREKQAGYPGFLELYAKG